VIRRSILILVAAACTLTAVAPGAADAASSCRKPAKLKVVKIAAGRVALRWRTPKHGTFRVLRGTRVVGQTRHHSMPVNLRPGRKIKLAVGIVGHSGRKPRCWARITARISKGGPITKSLLPPSHVRIERVADGVATIAWDAAAEAKRYRVARDHATVGETAKHQYAVRVAAGRSASVTVASVGAGGAVGPASAPLVVRTDL
jgi:hypothetical protein